MQSRKKTSGIVSLLESLSGEELEIEALSFIEKSSEGAVLLENLNSKDFHYKELRKYFTLLRNIEKVDYIPEEETLRKVRHLVKNKSPQFDREFYEEKLQEQRLYRDYAKAIYSIYERLKEIDSSSGLKKFLYKDLEMLTALAEERNQAIEFKLGELNEEELISSKVFEKIPYAALSGINFEPGHLHIIGSRPGKGKTTLILNFCLRLEAPTCILSYEMPIRLLHAKMVRIYGNLLNGEDISKFTASLQRAREEKNILCIDSSKLEIDMLVAKIRSIHRREKINIFFIDYLGLIPSTKRYESRALQVGEYTRKLKLLAIELDICVVCLAQLNREIEKTRRQVPTLSDLKESGAIEADADVVFLLNSSEKEKNKLFIYVAKNRYGTVGQRELYFNQATGRMEDLHEE